MSEAGRPTAAVPRSCIGALVRTPWTASIFWSRLQRKDERTHHSAAQPRCPPLPSFPRLVLLLLPPRAAANGCGQCHAVTVMAGRRGCGAWRPDDPPPQSGGILERGAAHPSAPSGPVHATIPPPTPPPTMLSPPRSHRGAALRAWRHCKGGAACVARRPRAGQRRCGGGGGGGGSSCLSGPSGGASRPTPSLPPSPLPAAAGLWRPQTRLDSSRGERRCPHAPQWLPRAGAWPPSPRTCCPRAGGSQGAG